MFPVKSSVVSSTTSSMRTQTVCRWPCCSVSVVSSPRLIIRSSVDLEMFNLVAASALVTLTTLMSSLCSRYARRYQRRWYVESGWRVAGVISDFRGIWGLMRRCESEGSNGLATGCLCSQNRTSLNGAVRFSRRAV